VAAGYSTNDDDKTRFALARYQPDGDLDRSFADDGKTLTSFKGGEASAYAVAIQENGKAVAAGYTVDDNDRRFALARYEAK
jgi:hypothetical protein